METQIIHTVEHQPYRKIKIAFKSVKPGRPFYSDSWGHCVRGFTESEFFIPYSFGWERKDWDKDPDTTVYLTTTRTNWAYIFEPNE